MLETDELEADEWTTVSNIIKGEYSNPVRVVAFNIAEGWSQLPRILRAPLRASATGIIGMARARRKRSNFEAH